MALQSLAGGLKLLSAAEDELNTDEGLAGVPPGSMTALMTAEDTDPQCYYYLIGTILPSVG